MLEAKELIIQMDTWLNNSEQTSRRQPHSRTNAVLSLSRSDELMEVVGKGILPSTQIATNLMQEMATAVKEWNWTKNFLVGNYLRAQAKKWLSKALLKSKITRNLRRVEEFEIELKYYLFWFERVEDLIWFEFELVDFSIFFYQK